MITVIVPVYKTQDYLKKCVASILCQTYRDLKIILVDDGSPDACGKICDELAREDERIHVLHQMNSGQSSARNNGLAWAFQNGCGESGDYFAFVDSDDTIAPSMYQMMVDVMSDNVDLVICGYQIVRREYEIKNEVIPIKKNIEMNQNELWEEVFGHLNNAVWNKLYRAELLKDIRFPSNIRHGEDLMFLLACITI